MRSGFAAIASCNPATGCAHANQNGTTCGTGAIGAGGGICQTGVCSIGSNVTAAISCKAIHTANPAFPTGNYWLDPDGNAGGAAETERT